MNIKIILRDDYNFPQHLYMFYQEIIDKYNDKGFITGMQFTSDEWEYQIFFTELEVLGTKWIKQSDLSTQGLKLLTNDFK